MKTYNVTLTGTQPLLMHNDDVEWADRMEGWRSETANKKTTKAGDDRKPSFTWLGSLYRNESRDVIMPTGNIMRCLMEGGAMVTMKGNKTFKSQTQSGIQVLDIGWPVLVNGKKLDGKRIDALLDEKDFKVHQQKVKEIGFELDVRRAKVQQSKHVRVRPRFDAWSVSGQLIVTDELITAPVLREILTLAGRYKGLGDWRPGGPTPGTKGTFTAVAIDAG